MQELELEKMIATTTVATDSKKSTLCTKLEFPNLMIRQGVIYQFLDVLTTIENGEGVAKTEVYTTGKERKIVSNSQDSATLALRKHALVIEELRNNYETDEQGNKRTLKY